MGGLGDFSGLPAASLAWLLFMESGEPGYYMMYNDLMLEDIPKDEKKDKRLE